MCKSGPPADGTNLHVSFYLGRRLTALFCMSCSIRIADSWYSVTKNLYPDPQLTAVKGLNICIRLVPTQFYLLGINFIVDFIFVLINDIFFNENEIK